MKLTRDNIAIRQDRFGRFMVNDLHKASGNNPNYRPSKWLRTKQTKETIAALNAESDPQIRGDSKHSQSPNMGFGVQSVSVVRGGEWNGVYVCWELVYDYAMWISPAFKIKVIRAFHAMMTRPRLQHEKSLAARYPFYPKLREEVLQGRTDAQIAPVIGRSAGSVGYHRRKQFNEGFADPVEYAYKRYSRPVAEKVIAKHEWDRWGSNFEPQQATLNLKFGENT